MMSGGNGMVRPKPACAGMVEMMNVTAHAAAPRVGTRQEWTTEAVAAYHGERGKTETSRKLNDLFAPWVKNS
jgi:hypothetical protein